ncbi:type II secretion system F family protein [Brachybacterium kimchii]|uniref:Type II secretion system F family protein n=1 Tax=Brachybacterium kimchii TaxID=2942909 RepID=A0ABY4NDV4_9MICO|nr:type II secretion system F family protein [Brachybacterium kimchii]UQN31825.1 type II secretion system F family protein [Brachybacterium kimchii]
MMPPIAAALVLTLGAGLWLFITGLRPTGTSATHRAQSRRLSGARRQQLRLGVIGLVIGIAVWLLTGYFVAVIAGPAIALITPSLIPRSTGKKTIDRLNGMEEWARSLSGLLSAGGDIEQAIIASRNSAPEALKEEIGMLAARLQAGIPIEHALEALGDDLDDPTGDMLVGSLSLGARRRGSGLARLLEGTASTISDDVAARRQIEADRAKPRANARFIAAIAVLVIAGEFIFNPSYVEPYKTPLGQIVLIALVALFLVGLVGMNLASREPKGQRLLRPTGGTR